MLVHLGNIQELVAAQVPDREAVVWSDGVLTHAALTTRSRRIASALRGLGLGCRTERGDLQP
jgi:non-ribosomal peptide synthetase component E (peptide arylation enzyme)